MATVKSTTKSPPTHSIFCFRRSVSWFIFVGVGQHFRFSISTTIYQLALVFVSCLSMDLRSTAKAFRTITVKVLDGLKSPSRREMDLGSCLTHPRERWGEERARSTRKFDIKSPNGSAQ